MKVVISAGFSEGHALPALALAGALTRRGHEVAVELDERWRESVESLGAGWIEGRPYAAFPGDSAAAGGRTVSEAARALAGAAAARDADLVVADLVATAAPLAAELAGIRWASLSPTLYPARRPGMPPFALGALPPRTRAGALAWRGLSPITALRPTERWLRRVPHLIDAARAELGLPSARRSRQLTTYGPLSDGLTLVATFPQLERAQGLPAPARITGPMIHELPGPLRELPRDAPLVLVAASTVASSRELIAAALQGLARSPVRVLAALNRRGESWPGPVPPNAEVADWVSYGQAMPRASAVICAGGHGTVVRALAVGTPVLVCPTGAESAENGARATFAGAGLMIPRRLLGPAAVRAAVTRLLGEPSFAARAAELATWARANDGAERGAELLERYARGSSSGSADSR